MVQTITKVFAKLGATVGETQKIAIDNIGTGLIAPTMIILSPGPKTKEAKDEKKYQAWRQPVSAFAGFTVSMLTSMPIGHRLKILGLRGKFKSHMNPSLFFDTLKFNNVQEFLNTLGTKIPLSSQLKQNISDIFVQSTKIVELEGNLVKNVGMASESRVMLIKQIKQLKGQVTDQLRKDVLNNPEINKKQFNQLIKYINEEANRSFNGFKQLFQWIFVMTTFPIGAWFMNVLHPIFMRTFLPELDNAVRGKVQRVENKHHK